MKIQNVKFLSLLMLISLTAFACGGGGDNTKSETPDQMEPSPQAEKTGTTPEEIGKQIGDIYVQAMADLAAALKDKPAASEVKGKIETMREEYIQKLVELGKLREALSAADRSKVDSQINMKVNGIYNSPDYAAFNVIQQHYFSEQSFHKIIMSFNILTQYASFELLKQQEPEEAARLGIH